jgi:hypothetical protein
VNGLLPMNTFILLASFSLTSFTICCFWADEKENRVIVINSSKPGFKVRIVLYVL